MYATRMSTTSVHSEVADLLQEQADTTAALNTAIAHTERLRFHTVTRADDTQVEDCLEALVELRAQMRRSITALIDSVSGVE